jgi:class 3 adenylate cyclase
MEGAEDITNPTRELAAIMFSDVVGYTAIMATKEGLRAGPATAQRSTTNS